MLWNIEFYESPNGKYPVAEFIDSLEIKPQARIAQTLDLLEEFGIELGMPYTKYLEKQLWELRIRVERNRYRIIYFLHTEKTFYPAPWVYQKDKRSFQSGHRNSKK